MLHQMFGLQSVLVGPVSFGLNDFQDCRCFMMFSLCICCASSTACDWFRLQKVGGSSWSGTEKISSLHPDCCALCLVTLQRPRAFARLQVKLLLEHRADVEVWWGYGRISSWVGLPNCPFRARHCFSGQVQSTLLNTFDAMVTVPGVLGYSS